MTNATLDLVTERRTALRSAALEIAARIARGEKVAPKDIDVALVTLGDSLDVEVQREQSRMATRERLGALKAQLAVAEADARTKGETFRLADQRQSAAERELDLAKSAYWEARVVGEAAARGLETLKRRVETTTRELES